MMMAKTGEGTSVTMDDLFSLEDGSDDLLIDLECFWNIFEEPSDTEEGGLEVLPSTGALQGSQNSKEALTDRAVFPEVGVQSPSYNSEASDYRTGCSDDISEPSGNPVVLNSERIEQSSQLSSAENICSTSITNCIPGRGNGLSGTYFDGGSLNTVSFIKKDSKKDPFEIPSHSGTFSLRDAKHMTHKGASSDFCYPNHEENLFGHPEVGVHSEILYHNKLMKESNPGTSVEQMEEFSFIDRDRSSYASHTDSSSCEITGMDIPDFLSEDGGDMCFLSQSPPLFLPSQEQDYLYSSGFKSLANDDGRMVHVMDEGENPTENFTSLMPSNDHIGGEVAINRGFRLANFNVMNVTESELAHHSSNTFLNMRRKVQDHIKFEKNGSVTSIDTVSRASEVIRGVLIGKHYGGGDELSASEGIKRISSNSLPSVSHMNYVSHAKDEREDILLESKKTLLTLGSVGANPVKNSAAVAHDWHRVLQVSEQPGILTSPSVKAELNCLKLENNVTMFTGSYISNTTYQRVQNSSFEQSNADDDSDVCILEDMSAPARQNPDLMNDKMAIASQFLTSGGPHDQTATGHLRLKSNNERAIFRVVMQDLSQPKSEATPPDGVLAVPLLKHQRIALSWMINKETKSACCSGGILADDQGLGKTISTIALILKERSSSSKVPKANKEQSKTETLNLDDDDDDDVVSEEGAESPQVNGCPINGGKTRPQGKGRPAAGTLIVCPTSVLRQWSDELRNKVTSEADLSVLVYHGSNRTKDPFELAKYDVVVTTYAIVSMEVPKQPVVNENDDLMGTPFKGFSSSKKRKLLESIPDKIPSRSKKSKKGIDNELFETISGPLAKVGWFRIVLDEAQSIKNHRTQVARACWGLRAKRRWCLSGTPIQNAIDDLYSYFRFLRHEPYAVFRTFCEQLKAPIHKNPKDGYKKLQAVLRTIMLRRTKGTFIDGEPIVNLPPKTIEMKKVDFSKEERDFYCRLESESRAQFAEYAAAGTVKQNYVNILLMLLRLRQACDHPILVKGFYSNSKKTSSIEMAKKLSREKQIFLLNCLEASLAICGICSDPPEDAVVTICGHVYCNQCICQHAIGEDTQCPTKNCKNHLSLSCVFSTTTLRTSLSDQLSVENTHNCSDSALAEINEPCSLSRPQDSSKIKAALELLLSLSKPHSSSSRMSSSESLEGGGYGTEKLHVCDPEGDNGNSDMDRNSINSVTVVGEKAIVFSQWTRMLDLLEACLKSSCIQYRRLDGTMPVVARDRAVKDFNTLPQVSVMIMSLKAASLGLNMVAACRVLLLDLWWNPTTEDQAIDRAHRIGQTRPVSVFRLTVKDTVEDRILALQQRKREMVASAFGEDETGSRQTRLTVEDLKYLFKVD